RGILSTQKIFRTSFFTILWNGFFSGYDYRESKFVIGIDTEKVLDARFTGLNTRSGGLLTVKFKYATPQASGAINQYRMANLMHIVLHSDHILEIHDTGARVSD
ncbi:MAG: hypothetical protein ACKPKO_56470, partial [Candidatus Fonsibacter sp.]